MRDFDHPNVMKFLGMCFDAPEGYPYIILPFMANGSLLDYLKKKTSSSSPVSSVGGYLEVGGVLTDRNYSLTDVMVCVCVCIESSRDGKHVYYLNMHKHPEINKLETLIYLKKHSCTFKWCSF